LNTTAMNTQDNTPSSGRSATRWTLPVILITVIVGTLALKLLLPPHWHALLELKNTGTKPMTVVFKGRTTVTKPGEAWKGDFRAGDTISIASEQPASAWFNLQMPTKNPKPWTMSESTAQHWTAEVNADDPANIRVEKRVWTEVTIPPSPWQPWP
jgi:hypothetical protein